MCDMTRTLGSSDGRDAPGKSMLNIFITIDTEFWPRRTYSGPSDYVPDFQRDIHGKTRDGKFGLGYQLDLLNAHGLRAVFFVEALCAYALGSEPVQETVQLVQDGGHDVQLHLHTEWLSKMPEPFLPGRVGQHIRHFSLDEQRLLIEKGLEKLRACGAENVCAFRAGNFGANFDTLRALAAGGIRFDTSHCTCFLGSACDMETGAYLLQPQEMFGVWEFPVTFFRDFRRRSRPVQLAACSSGEIEHALLQAWHRGWHSVVVVSHTFELIRGRNHGNGTAKADWIAVRRFERLCRFLSEHKAKFRTRTFSDPMESIAVNAGSEPLHAPAGDTSIRLLEQLMRRMLR